MTTLCAWDLSVALHFSQAELLNTKPCTRLTYFNYHEHFARSRTRKVKKARLAHYTVFSRTMNFDELSLCFYFGRWYCVHAEFYVLNGTSIIESVVIRSQDLLYSGTLLHSVMHTYTHTHRKRERERERERELNLNFLVSIFLMILNIYV